MDIPLSKMYMDDEIKRAVLEVLESGRFVKGPNCKAFEEEFSVAMGTKGSVAVNSGTSALMLAYKALGLSKDDEIILPSHTFIATAEPVVESGAKAVFVDIDPANYTIDPAAIEEAVTDRTKGIVVVHLYGHPADMDRIMAIADEHDLWVLEDTAQAPGAKVNGRTVSTIGDIGIFSFFPAKNMTVSGDGGMVSSNDEDLISTVRMMRDHGRGPGDKYISRMLGYNYRLSEIHAAIGRQQLGHLPSWSEARRKVAGWYADAFASRGVSSDAPDDNGIVIPKVADWAEHVFYMYVIRSSRRDELQAYLKENGVSCGIHYPMPVHKQPPIGSDADLPVTDEIVEQILSIPMHPFMTPEEVDHVADAITRFYGGGAR